MTLVRKPGHREAACSMSRNLAGKKALESGVDCQAEDIPGCMPWKGDLGQEA